MLYDDIVFIKKTVRNTSKEDAVTNDFISEADLQEIQDVTKDSLDWVLDLVERAETPEEKLRLLESTKDKRSYNQPKYEDPEEDESDQDDLEGSGNQVIGSYTALDTKVNFRGKGNVLIVEDGVTLEDSRIGFKGDNSIVYLSKAEQPYRIQVTMHTDTNLYIGENSRFTQDKPVTMSIAEAQSVLIGDNCSFGKGCWFRTSDQHPIYDQKTRKRLNQPKSILVGDNVTLPDKSLVFKGRKIGVVEDDARGNKYVNALKELQETTEQSVRIELMRKLKFDQ